jgi:hypothetical protein
MPTTPCAFGQHASTSTSTSTSTGPSPGAEKHFDLASIPSPFVTREMAAATLRREFHAADLARHLQRRAAERWELRFAREIAEGSGLPEVVNVTPLDPRTVPASAAAWLRQNPRP